MSGFLLLYLMLQMWSCQGENRLWFPSNPFWLHEILTSPKAPSSTQESFVPGNMLSNNVLSRSGTRTHQAVQAKLEVIGMKTSVPQLQGPCDFWLP